MTGQAATVHPFEDWYFCQRLNCRDGEVFPLVRERYSARQWLQRLKTDAFRMLALRSLLSRARGWDLGRLSDDAVIDQIADLVITSRLHIHMPRVAVFADGGSSQQSTASTESKTETSPAFPLSDRSRRGASAAPSRQPIVDAPTFSSDMDSAAQAATLVAAAATGAAACHL